MININITMADFEISPWIKELVFKKSQRLSKLDYGKRMSIYWSFQREGNLYWTKLKIVIPSRHKPFQTSAKSKRFKNTIDLVLGKAERELLDLKEKKTNKIHRNKREFLYSA